MEDWQRSVEVGLGEWRQPEGRESESRQEGCFGKARTRTHRRAKAQPWVASDGRVKKVAPTHGGEYGRFAQNPQSSALLEVPPPLPA